MTRRRPEYARDDMKRVSGSSSLSSKNVTILGDVRRQLVRNDDDYVSASSGRDEYKTSESGNGYSREQSLVWVLTIWRCEM